MASHGLPITPGPVTPPTTNVLLVTNREYALSTTTNITETVSRITKDVGELFKDLPYVKACAGIVLQIIRIREEIQTAKDRTQELIDKILRRSNVIFNALLRVAVSPNKARLKDTEEKLNEYKCLLQQILNTLMTQTSKGMRSKINQIVNRNSRIETLAKYNRLIDDFNTDFVTELQLKAHLDYPPQPTQPPAIPPNILHKPIPLPDPMIGRDEEQCEVIQTLLHHASPRIAILGAGGMGKTTLALSVLHDRDIAEQYPSRYFVPCEAVKSLSALVWEIANALQIPLAARNENLLNVILSSFSGKCILCLDNFETIWEDEAIRPEIEDFLSHLDHLPQLAIMTTMRGAQRPSRVSWSKPLLPPLKKLSNADSKLIFETSCGPVDEFVEKLLKAVDGIPLAIKLISAQLQEGLETSELLWARWEETQTSAIGVGSRHRLSNLDTSIHLSVYSPRMQSDPNAMRVLAMLSNLPDGFPHQREAIGKLQCHFPGNISLQGILLTLQRVSLVHVDESGPRPRIRMLEPIRDYCCIKLQITSPLDHCVVSFYAELLHSLPDITDSASHAVIPQELPNIHSVFAKALNEATVDRYVVAGSMIYTCWSVWTGNHTEEIIDLAVQKTTGSPSLHAQCLSILSQVYVHSGKLDEAESCLSRAVELHRQSHDMRAEASDVLNLGELFLRWSKLDKAESSLERALELHRLSNNMTGEARNLGNLGELYFRQKKLDEAQSSLTRALELDRQLHNVHGEAVNFRRLGEVYMYRSQLEEAESSFEKAIELHRQSHDVLGEATAVQKLGELYMRQNKLDKAKASFEAALKLDRQIHSVSSEAYDIRNLGAVYLRLDELDKAESSFVKALELHRQVHDVIGEAYAVQDLGELCLRRSKFDEAESYFKSAIELHHRAHSVLGEANNIQNIGQLYLKQDKLDEAESSFERARDLHHQLHSMIGEAGDIENLGLVYLQRDKLDEAESAFKAALELFRKSHGTLGEANNHLNLGEVYGRQGKLSGALSNTRRAMELYSCSNSLLGAANALKQMAKVCMQLKMLDEAEQCLSEALRLHRQCEAAPNEASDLRLLEELRRRREGSPMS